jgi:hypothetical protein
MQSALVLHTWGELGEAVLAVTAIIALGVAWFQLQAGNNTARRERVYAYQERVNAVEFRREAVRYRQYWETHSYEQYKDNATTTRLERNELLILPNLMEEIAALYNRKLLDRNVAAETLGIYVDELWTASTHFIAGLRADHGDKAFCEWQEMVENSPQRKLTVDRKLTRRRAWRKLFKGT